VDASPSFMLSLTRTYAQTDELWLLDLASFRCVCVCVCVCGTYAQTDELWLLDLASFRCVCVCVCVCVARMHKRMSCGSWTSQASGVCACVCVCVCGTYAQTDELWLLDLASFRCVCVCVCVTHAQTDELWLLNLASFRCVYMCVCRGAPACFDPYMITLTAHILLAQNNTPLSRANTNPPPSLRHITIEQCIPGSLPLQQTGTPICSYVTSTCALLPTPSWTKVETPSTPPRSDSLQRPPERMAHTMTALKDGRVVLVGGRNKEGICSVCLCVCDT